MMFSFFDNKTPAVAERLYARAMRDKERYLHLTLEEIGRRVKTELPDLNCFVGYDQIGYVYDDLPEFSFSVMSFMGPLTLSIDSGGPYSGMLLQFQADDDRANVGVTKPAMANVGPKAKRLAQHLESTFGVRYLNRTLGPLMSGRYPSP